MKKIYSYPGRNVNQKLAMFQLTFVNIVKLHKICILIAFFLKMLPFLTR